MHEHGSQLRQRGCYRRQWENPVGLEPPAQVGAPILMALLMLLPRAPLAGEKSRGQTFPLWKQRMLQA